MGRVFRIITISLACIALVVLLFAVRLFRTQSQESAAQVAHNSALLQDAVTPLRNEKRLLEDELAILQAEIPDEETLSGATNVIIDSPHKNALTEIVPVVENAGYRGIIAVPWEFCPGDDGAMSETEFSNLLSRGWAWCLEINETTDVQKLCDWMITKKGFAAPSAVYSVDGIITPEQQEALVNNGILFVIRYPSEANTELSNSFFEMSAKSFFDWRLNTDPPLKDSLADGEIVFVVCGYGDVATSFETNELLELMSAFNKYVQDGLGEVRSPEKAALIVTTQQYNRLEALAEAESKRADLEARLAEIDAEIQQAYDQYAK